jgi:HSP20 family molecular chaperone IbpA
LKEEAMQTKKNGSMEQHRDDVVRRCFRPRTDVFENETEYLVVADVPGVATDAIDVRFEDGELTIEARRTDDTRGTALATESGPGDYRRAFALPEGVDADKIDASLANGILSVHVPKSAAKRARRIDVRSA